MESTAFKSVVVCSLVNPVVPEINTSIPKLFLILNHKNFSLSATPMSVLFGFVKKEEDLSVRLASFTFI